jgi:8-oxo-dGTP pyrophosphatase MutT (NUDIX family)
VTGVVEKVTAIITRERDGIKEVLLFQHPNAGVQVPAGTVDPGEAIEDAVIREGQEETGLESLRLVQYLGTIENELEPGQQVLTEVATIYLEPDFDSLPYRQTLGRGVSVRPGETRNDFSYIQHLEYDQLPDPTCIIFNLSGWIRSDILCPQKRRHLYELTTTEATPQNWQLVSDGGRIFKPFWTPLTPRPSVVPPQDRWLGFVGEGG